MQFLRKIGGLLGRHYEKVLLAVGLIGLIYAVVHLYSKKQSEEEKIREFDRQTLKRKTKPVPPVDLAALNKALEQATNPPALNLGLPHNVFNPVKWQQKPDGSVIKIEKGTEVGPEALKIAKVSPLSTIITLDKATTSGVQMTAVQEASTNAALRSKRQSYLTPNSSDDRKLYTLREIHGVPDKPEAVIELAGGEKVTVTPEKPYSKVEGFKVDLLYPPEGKNFSGKRAGDVLNLAGEDYNIVAINSNEIVVSARSNNRRYTIRNNAAP